MTSKERLLHELESLPPAYFDELLAFVQRLKLEAEDGTQPTIPDTAFASQEVLARDWLTHEEDTAWHDL